MATVLGLFALFLLSLGVFPFIGVAYFPRTDPGQFVVNLKAPTGTRIETTERFVKRVEDIIREEVPKDLDVIVANIGVHAWILLDLHQQLGASHRLRAGQPEGATPHRQLRVHGTGAPQGRPNYRK